MFVEIKLAPSLMNNYHKSCNFHFEPALPNALWLSCSEFGFASADFASRLLFLGGNDPGGLRFGQRGG